MIKTPKPITNYSIVCNEVARRTDLSARAKGIYYYLATLPPDWKLSQKECFKHFKEGKEALATAFKELVIAGYIRSIEYRDKGRFKGTNYEVFWTSQLDNRDTDIPIPEKPEADTWELLSNY